jgi:methylphosphotriester-DNA--protein-cysteine methyltransferase
MSEHGRTQAEHDAAVMQMRSVIEREQPETAALRSQLASRDAEIDALCRVIKAYTGVLIKTCALVNALEEELARLRSPAS